jgi:hypothetical protein
VPLEYSE